MNRRRAGGGRGAGSRRRNRRTQEERSAETRQRLMDATVDCLSERGWADTSTTEICRRAGVSRGAQVHHFPTKLDLVTAALTHVFEARVVEFRHAFRDLPDGADRAEAAIDMLWPIFSGPVYEAWLELVVASRTDTALHRRVVELNTALRRDVVAIWREFFPPPPGAAGTWNRIPAMAFAIFDGIALNRIHGGDQAETDDLVGMLRNIAGLVMTPAGTTRDDARPDSPAETLVGTRIDNDNQPRGAPE